HCGPKRRFGVDSGQCDKNPSRALLSEPLGHNHLLDDFSLMLDDKMRVALHHSECFVAQHIRDLEKRCALRRKHRSGGMTQVMEAKVTDPGRLERGVPVRIEML